MTEQTTEPLTEALQYEGRFFIEGAKSSIESAIQIIEEAVSNEDEAIRQRVERDGEPPQGRVTVAYDPEAMELTVTGDGIGMTSERMRKRLGRLGAKPEGGALRSYFNRGIREVFLALGGGEVTSIGRNAAGEEVLSRIVFFVDEQENMMMRTETVDRSPEPKDREHLGLEGTGTRVTVSVRRLEKAHPKQFHFNELERSVRNCVGLRPVLQDPAREIMLAFGDTEPRLLRFSYPEAEDLIVEKEVEVGGLKGTLWARLAPKAIKRARNKRAWIAGILIRGERAAYEIARDPRLAKFPAMERVIGELRLDGIEDLQRHATAEDQLVYKTDRSGLVGEHPVVAAAYDLLVAELEPLIADLEANRPETKTSPDVRRELQKLAKEINSVIDGAVNVGPEDNEAEPSKNPDHEPGEPPPDVDPEPMQRELLNPMEFPLTRAMVYAGETKSVKLWVNAAVIPPGTMVEITSAADSYISAAILSSETVPPAAEDGISEISIAVTGGNAEGRYEMRIRSGKFEATLPLHVRFRRASGFITSIDLVPEDWESGSAIWDHSSGVVRVMVGRPEFKAAERAATGGPEDAMKDPIYRQLVVESVREAALWEAARMKAEFEWDDLPAEDRSDGRNFQRETQFIFQEFDYQLRAKLHKAFAQP